MSRIKLQKSHAVPGKRIRLPASKSLSNRLLILSELSSGAIQVEGSSDAGDTLVLRRVLEELRQGKEWVDLADAGTAMRFTTAFATLVSGDRVLTGTARMKERPIRELVEALQKLGAELRYQEQEGFPPLRIKGGELKGGAVSVRADRSSQFLSALALIAAFTDEGIRMELLGESVSRPYFRMTLDLLYGMGVPIREDGEEVFIPPFTFPEQRLHVEGDHSSAAFWYEYLALKGKGAVFLEGIRSTSSQGDRELPRFFDQLGVSESWEEEGCWVEAIPGQVDDEAYEAEMRDHPDLVPALVGALAGLGKKGVLNGVGSLRFKESDRIQALSDELAKVGVELRSEGELLGVDPSGFDPEATPNFASHNDHRIVMALAPLAAILPYCSIEDPEVVRKSYPGFWDDLHRLDPSVFPPDQKDPRS